MNGTNPFALIQGTINNEIVFLRPVQFDSSEYDKNFKKPDGSTIRPTMAQTTCPKCSCMIEHMIPYDFNDSILLKINCSRCNPPVSSAVFPFEDPIKLCKIQVVDINPNAASNIRLMPKKPVEPKVAEKVVEDPVLSKMFKPVKPMGLGEFIKNRSDWNKLKQKLETNFVSKSEDAFDVLGNIPEHVSNNEQL